jgi:hypothetical protein
MHKPKNKIHFFFMRGWELQSGLRNPLLGGKDIACPKASIPGLH